MKVSMNGLKQHLASAFNDLVSVVNENDDLKLNDQLVDSIYNLKAYVATVVCLYDENDPDNTDLDIELADIEEV